MAIKAYKVKNKTLYEVYVSVRSTTNSQIRIQKRKKGIESEAKAKRLLKELELVCREEARRSEVKGESWSEIVGKFKTYHESFGNVQQDTIEDYASMLKIWTAHFWDKQFRDISRSDVRTAIEKARSAGKSNSHLRKLLHTTGRVYKWAKDEGYFSNVGSVTSGIVISKVEERAPKILSWEQLIYFLQKASDANHPWYDVWAVAIYTGMRSGELFSLKWTNVDLDKRKILVDLSFNRRKNVYKSTKSGQFRSVPINDVLFGVLVKLKNTSTSEFVLPRHPKWIIGHQSKCVQSFCSEIGLPLINFHTFRACFATHLLSQGVPLGQVMKVCGWAELKTVQKYNRLAGVNEKGATDCLNGLAPSTMGPNILSYNG